MDKIFKTGIIQAYYSKFLQKDTELIGNTLYPFLGLIGNFCYSSKGFCTILMKLNIFEMCFEVIDEYNKYGIINENLILIRAIWVLCNLANDSQHAAKYLFDRGILDKLFPLIKRDGIAVNIAHEVLTFFCSFAYPEEPEIIIKMYHAGIIDVCIKFLRIPNIKILVMAAECVKSCIAHGFLLISNEYQLKNFFLEKFVKSGGADEIKNLLVSNFKFNHEFCSLLQQIEKWCDNFVEES